MAYTSGLPTASAGYGNNTKQMPFGDEFAPPKVKETPKYGLQCARAMYLSQNRYGYRLFNDITNYNALMELAQGRQSVEPIYRMLGFFNDAGATQSDNQSLAYIDIQVLNLVTKYINRAVAKLQRTGRYNISFTAVDPLSVNEAKEHNAKIQSLYQMRDWFKSMKLNAQDYFPEMDLSVLPEYPEELLFNLSVNPKIKKIVDAEKTMKLLNNTINDMGQIMRECDWYSAVIGRQHVHCYLDENNIPRAQPINPKFWGGSYVENEDYSKQEYSFFIEFITRNQLKKEAQGMLTKAQLEEILSAHAFPNTAASFGTLPQYYDNYDGLEYIPVMRFYFLSNDNVAWKIWNHQDTGNKMYDQTHYNYFPTENSQKDQKVVQNSWTNVYGGTWVLDSEIVYNYGRKKIPHTNLVNTRLPIVTFAPNMKEGRIVSLCAQMVEPANMINVAWNRMKDILAKGRMGPIELNLTAIDNIALGKGGEKWTEKQAIDFFMQSGGIYVTRQTTSPYGQSMGQMIREMNAGLTIADYMTTITSSINFMNELSGSSVVESSSLPDRLTTGAMKSNIDASNDAIEYLINGHRQVYKETSHMLMLLAQQAKMDKTKIQGMIPALGTSTTEFFEVPDDIAYCDYGLQMQPEPTEEEWIEFYGELIEAVKLGRLNSSDSAFIRQIKDMTMARQVMANREKINEAKAMKIRQADQQFQMQAGVEANKSKLEVEMQLLEKKKQDDIELMQLQAKIDDALMQRKVTLEGEVNKTSEMVKSQIARQQGIDSVLKEAMRSRSEDKKTEAHKEVGLASTQAQNAKTAVDAHVKMTVSKNKPQPKK